MGAVELSEDIIKEVCESGKCQKPRFDLYYFFLIFNVYRQLRFKRCECTEYMNISLVTPFTIY